MKKHLPQLDGLRAIAILMVFIHHAFPVPLLWAGVDLFFILSGYLITSILLVDRERFGFRELCSRFYLRRAERILPAYLIFLLMVLAFARPAASGLWPYLLSFTQNIPFATHRMPFSALYPLWSLAVEQHFYLMWPAVVFFLPRRWLVRVLAALLVLTPVLRAACTPLFSNPDPIYSLTPFRLDALAFGALAAVLLPRLPAVSTIRVAKLGCATGVAFYAALSFLPAFHRQANTPLFNGLGYSLNLVVLGGFFVWTTLSEGTLLTRALSVSWLRGLGRISYMFYLVHFGVLNAFRDHFGLVPAALLSFGVSAGFATLSWFLVEKPVLHFTPNRRRRGVSARTVLATEPFSTAEHLSLGA